MQLKILSLGDEYTLSARRYLVKAAKSDDVKIVTGCMMLEDASLENIFRMISEDVPVFNFEYNEEGSVRMNEMSDVSASKIFSWTDWDYITVQQTIGKAGNQESYIPFIRDISDFIRQNCPDARLIINEPWAFESDCKEDIFGIYNNNQRIMADRIRAACIRASEEADIKIVFPVGEAWSNARAQNFCRLTSENGCHASRCGEFLASALWYEILTGNDIRKNSYRLPFVETHIAKRLREVAHETALKYAVHK